MRRTKQEAALTREAILDAAEHAFLEFGVSRTSLAQIAQYAGVTRGAVYFHFADKAEIFRAIIARVRFPQEEMITQILSRQSVNPLDVLEEAAFTCLQRFCHDEQQQRVLIILTQRCEYVGEFSDMSARLRQAIDQMIDLFTRMLRVAKERGMLHANWEPENAARALVSIVGGLIGEWLHAERTYDLTSLGRHVVSTQIAAFRA